MLRWSSRTDRLLISLLIVQPLRFPAAGSTARRAADPGGCPASSQTQGQCSELSLPLSHNKKNPWRTKHREKLPSFNFTWLTPWEWEGKLIFQEESDTLSFPNHLEKCCSWDCFPWQCHAGSGDLFTAGLRLFDFCVLFDEKIIWFFINTEFSAGGMGSFLAESCQERERWVSDRSTQKTTSTSATSNHIQLKSLCHYFSQEGVFKIQIKQVFISEQWPLCRINTKHDSSVPEDLPKPEYTSIITI